MKPLSAAVPQHPGGQVTLPTTVIDARQSPLRVELAELWRFRELLGFLAWRDVRVRYAQTLMGAMWALLEPLVGVLVFTLIFNRVAGFEAGDVPYPLYCFAAMLLWTFFSRALRDVATSLVVNAPVLRKVYFPRLALPCAALLATLVDLACMLVMYFFLLAYYGLAPTPRLLTLPLWIALAGVNVLGIGLMLSAINVRFRDVTRALPFLIQVWLFVTPVAYPLDKIPAAWLDVYSLNPMVGVVEATRWALLPGYALNAALLVPSLVVGVCLLAAGTMYFVRAQREFADVI
jgi:lipopolysaccharide transport system permease protein